MTLLQGAEVSLVDRSATPQRKILTEVAQAVIRGALAEGKYEKRSGLDQPPYMAPSPDSTKYSSVCNSPTLFNTYDSSPHSGALSAVIWGVTWYYVLGAGLGSVCG